MVDDGRASPDDGKPPRSKRGGADRGSEGPGRPTGAGERKTSARRKKKSPATPKRKARAADPSRRAARRPKLGVKTRQQQAELFAELYDALLGYARSLMSNQPRSHTLQATALLHEAYAKMFRRDRTFTNREHFFAGIAKTMQRYLIDHARRVKAQKRGGGRQRVPTDPEHLVGSARPASERVDQLADIARALARLAEREPRAAHVAELRIFGGFDLSEIAKLVGISERTADREWNLACATIRAADSG